MKIKKITIKNFRLLKDTSIDLEEDLSLIIGKNNCGKTSLLLILDKFLGGNLTKSNFSFDDFNVDFKEELKSTIEGDELDASFFPFLGISLKLFIEYDEADDLSNIGNKVIMDLDPDNRMVVLSFGYHLPEGKFYALRKDYKEFNKKRLANKKTTKDIYYFLKEQHSNYFQLSKKSLQYDLSLQKEDDLVFTDLIKEKIHIDKIVSFKWISARRNVSNKDTEKTLSSQSSKMYKKLEASNNNPEVIDDFKEALSKTDEDLDKIYETLFEEIISDVKKFGGIKQDDSIIKIVSSLQHKELLEENTTVMYGLGSSDHSLPENYNGLGYMNLISMIFEIKILLHEFQKEKDEKPSDINLLFIEEPEVHTHPQMQYIFIKNIKALLQKGVEREDGENRGLQTILSTHSSHIVSESDFEDIKYFRKENAGIISKNLKDLKNEYVESNAHYKFLKQYLTLHRSELFFADKAIFIEGDTERIILPAVMKKLDQEEALRKIEENVEVSFPLLSQNISIIEVGAYSQIFEKFIDFIGIKSLIVTDIDSVKTIAQTDTNGEVKKNADETDKIKDTSCPVSEGKKTSNTSLKYFYGSDKSLSDFTDLSFDDRVLKKEKIGNEGKLKWVQSKDGHLVCVYQTEEDGYHARSFEDAFFHINQDFIKNNNFGSLAKKHVNLFKASNDAYALAKDGVGSKPSLAMEILLNSKSEEVEVQGKEVSKGKKKIIEFSNWKIPEYIREGLLWLKQD